jgi:hypothetical protein
LDQLTVIHLAIDTTERSLSRIAQGPAVAPNAKEIMLGRRDYLTVLAKGFAILGIEKTSPGVASPRMESKSLR